jgi:Rieske 2Fe-2S family protein
MNLPASFDVRTTAGGAGLPRATYLSDDWLSVENDTVFARNWSFVGIVNDFRNVGDYRTFSIGRRPMFVVRDADGHLRAFHNICRHRGTKLLDGHGNTEEGIVCGYHCWRYGLGGDLKSVPRSRQFPDLDKTELGLIPGSVQIHRGMVFAHVEQRTRSEFDAWLGPFDDYFGPYDLTDLDEVMFTLRPMKANWKLFVENHIESYHLWYAHRRSILGLDHEAQTNHYYNGHWSFYEPTLVHGQMAEFESRIPSRIIAPGPEWFGSGDHLLYPNLGVVTGAKFVGTLKVIPITARESAVEMRLFGLPEREEGEQFGYWSKESSEGTDLNGEDIELCERVQEGLGSDRFALGPLAIDYEQSIVHFHSKYREETGVDSIRAGTS